MRATLARVQGAHDLGVHGQQLPTQLGRPTEESLDTATSSSGPCCRNTSLWSSGEGKDGQGDGSVVA